MNRAVSPELQTLLDDARTDVNAPKRVGRRTVVRVTDAWYPACTSSELTTSKPLSRMILGVPLAVFRATTGPAAVLDRCPHRNVPLSAGSVVNGELQCRYHGWRFDGAGSCTAIPGLKILDDSEVNRPGRCASAFPVRESDGFVWVWMNPAKTPDVEPFALSQVHLPGYLTIHRSMDIDATLHSVLENILDVPHTSFLHGGLFRTEKKRTEIQAIVRRRKDRVEAEFIGEPRPEGIIGRVLSPSGGMLTHFDRFFLPCVAQVEYRIGSENHVMATTLCTPITETRTRMHSVLSLRTRIPMRALAPFAAPIVWRILQQDKEMLALQTHTIDGFGTEKFSSTPIDLLGPHILHLLKKAEAGALDDAVVRDETVPLLV